MNVNGLAAEKLETWPNAKGLSLVLLKVMGSTEFKAEEEGRAAFLALARRAIVLPLLIDENVNDNGCTELNWVSVTMEDLQRN